MTPQQQSFLTLIAPPAERSAAATGVPASVTMAQAILESGWGRTGLAMTANNYFGIKAEHLSDPTTYVEYQTHEFEHGVQVTVNANFERYPSLLEGFEDHARLLSQSPRYRPAMREADDPAAFCMALQQCGYSTAPTYSETLIGLINEFNLTQYDEEAA